MKSTGEEAFETVIEIHLLDKGNVPVTREQGGCVLWPFALSDNELTAILDFPARFREAAVGTGRRWRFYRR